MVIFASIKIYLQNLAGKHHILEQIIVFCLLFGVIYHTIHYLDQHELVL